MPNSPFAGGARIRSNGGGIAARTWKKVFGHPNAFVMYCVALTSGPESLPSAAYFSAVALMDPHDVRAALFHPAHYRTLRQDDFVLCNTWTWLLLGLAHVDEDAERTHRKLCENLNPNLQLGFCPYCDRM